MSETYIMEAIAEMIENKIIGEWHHTGYIDGSYCNAVRCVIDDKHYHIKIEAAHDEK